MNCWICGAPATTGEHKTKQSDLIEAHGRTCSRQRLFCRPSLSFSLASFVHTDNGSDLLMLIGELLPRNWRTEKLQARAA